jgi:DNA-binding winged helix-turn-helix (wHTH) protein
MIYLFDEFALDDQRYQFRRADDMLEVEPKVFDLLVYLIRHRERFVSREELIEQLWPDVVVSEAALTQCVAKARKAVRDGGGKQQVIKTQHGRGYRFVGTVTERSDGHSPPAPQIETPLHDTSSPVQAYARTAGNQSPVLSVTQPTRVDFVLHVILPTALRNARFAFTFLLLGLGFIAALQYLPLRSMPSPEMKYAEQGGADSVLTFVAKDPKSAWFLSANKPQLLM